MAKLFYLHWNEAEARARSAPLVAAGHRVHLHWSTETPPALKDNLPDIAILSLDRLPSHSRQVAEWLWEAKKRRHIPIIFEGGRPDKEAAARKQFPEAHFCRTGTVLLTLSQLAKLESGATPEAKRGRR